VTSSEITLAAAGGSTTGRLYIRGSGGVRTVDQSANDEIFAASGAYIEFENLKFTNSNGTKTNGRAFTFTSTGIYWFTHCIFGDQTNQLLTAFVRNAAGNQE